MDEERKQKTAALNSKKKLEGDLKDLESTMDMNNKMKEDAIKQLKKHQAALKELTALWGFVARRRQHALEQSSHQDLNPVRARAGPMAAMPHRQRSPA